MPDIVLPFDITSEVGGSVIRAGTRVASHYIFFEPGATYAVTGKVRFDSRVLDVITSTSLLSGKNALANTGVNYIEESLTGIETVEDTVSISAENEVSVSFKASNPGDHVRVLMLVVARAPRVSLADVPEPGSGLLLCGGLGLIVSWCGGGDPGLLPFLLRRQGRHMHKVNLAAKLALIQDYWNPRIAGELNGQHVKLVKFQGEFVWHRHDSQDEMFLVLHGTFRMEWKDEQGSVAVIPLAAGEFLIVPRSVEHRPVAEEEVHVLLFEPASTLNTGNVHNDLTVESPRRV